MNAFKRKVLFAAVIAGLGVAGCGLTPEQITAIGASKSATTVCHNAKGYGVESTTVVTNAGDGALPGMIQVTPDCNTGTARVTRPQ